MRDAALTERRSTAIAAARVMCVLGIVYVHAWTGLDGHRLAHMAGSAQATLRWGLIELVGRAAVPLLGAVSGWLAAGSVTRRGWAGFMRGKWRAIAVPMLAWNAIAVLLVGGAGALGWLAAPVPADAWRLANELTAIGAPNEINVQMPFLRDLLVCMALVPLLVRAPAAVVAAVIAGSAAWSVSGIAVPVLLRPSILTFFALGLLLRRREPWAAAIACRAPVVPALAYLALALVRIAVESDPADLAATHPVPIAMLDLLMRAVACALFWMLAWRLAGTRWAAWCRRLEAYVFVVFCSHLLLIWLVAPVIGRVTGPLGAPLYPAFLLLQPPLAFAGGVAIGRLLEVVAPRAAMWLSGGRLGRGRTTLA